MFTLSKMQQMSENIIKRGWRRFFFKQNDKFLVRRDFDKFYSDNVIFSQIFIGLQQKKALSTILNQFNDKALGKWFLESSKAFEMKIIPIIYEIAEAIGYEKNLRLAFVSEQFRKKTESPESEAVDQLKLR